MLSTDAWELVGRRWEERSGGGDGGPAAGRADDDAERPRGPGGGTTTISDSGMVKKNLWVPLELAEALRTKALVERRGEAEIVREALERLLGEDGV